MVSKIIDQYGQPLQSEILTTPQTSKIAWLQRQFDGHPSRGITPRRLASILDAAELGDIRLQHELFLDMEEKDGHILAEMSKRKRALLTVDWDIIPPRNASATEKKQAGYAKELIKDIPNFEDVILDTLDGIGHGFACQEIEWELLGSEWVPKSISHRPQTWFQTDYETRTQIRLRDMTLDGAELIPFGWIKHIHKAKSGYISRCGLHRTLAWPYLFKNYSVGDFAEFLEIYGLPLRLGKYQVGASEEDKATLLRAVMSIGHDAAGIIPNGMSIDFVEATKGSANADPFAAMTSWADLTVSKCVLGGTLTSQSDGKTSTNALGKIHNEVRHDLMLSDAAQLGSTYTNDLVYPLLALNKGGVADRRRLPKFRFNVIDPVDLSLLAEALPMLAGAGMRIPLQWAHEQGGVPVADPEEEILTPVAAPSKQTASAPAALSSAALNAEAITALSGQLGTETSDAWNNVMTHIADLVAQATSMADLQEKLTKAYAGLPLDAMRKVMAQGYQVAALAGMADVADGK